MRHMHNNFKGKYTGTSLKDKLWKCARALYVQCFDEYMKQIKKESTGAFEWLASVHIIIGLGHTSKLITSMKSC